MILLVLIAGLAATHAAAAQTVEWNDLVQGVRLPHGDSVALVGQLSDLKCGPSAVSDVLDITGITVSYPVRAPQQASAAITGSGWSVLLGELPVNTALTLHLKITGKIAAGARNTVAIQLLKDPRFSASASAPAAAGEQAERVLTAMTAKDGPLSNVLQTLLPSCALTTEVTPAAIKAVQANNGAMIKGDAIPQLNQGVELTQPSTTSDLSKYAGFDAGALHAPRINELRQFYMIHIYPWGPVGLETTGHVPFAQRWSVTVGASAADLSANANSPIKNGRAFAYGVGFRLNKYFRVSGGGMVYRDAASNRLLNVFCFGPSIDITALPGLTSIFSTQ